MTDFRATPSRAILAMVAASDPLTTTKTIGGIPTEEVKRAIRECMSALEADAKDPEWTTFGRAVMPIRDDVDYVRKFAADNQVPESDVREALRRIADTEHYRNSIYQVGVTRLEPLSGAMPPMVALSVKRNDQRPIRDWRHMQRIKDELVGPDCEGVELYPAQSRLVDSANSYHLWVVTDPNWRWPFGFDQRFVRQDSSNGAVQRPGAGG